ncbi:spermatogenesis associated 6-like protein isoform X1 [Ornithorhynchus anatinus]|uniref:spermatogenesis associated 6-like protein isoform X1 n=1 Tax=Ornithorhynchus anatinus TaxID=9258 RepID=UPI0010A881BE|nr:spermatogenesis associated 6-like protein isoform X1 [Ornithorhynchus anatinus]
MPLKLSVELEIRAVTCQGAFLPEKNVYLSVCNLNQYRATECFPPVFPIEIQHTMNFEKVFRNASEPADILELLECYTTKFELIQLVHPEGEILAFYEENTRQFLFPESTLPSSNDKVDREVVMKKIRGFPAVYHMVTFAHGRTCVAEEVSGRLTALCENVKDGPSCFGFCLQNLVVVSFGVCHLR